MMGLAYCLMHIDISPFMLQRFETLPFLGEWQVGELLAKHWAIPLHDWHASNPWLGKHNPRICIYCHRAKALPILLESFSPESGS